MALSRPGSLCPEALRRQVLMLVFGLGLASTCGAWSLLRANGSLTPGMSVVLAGSGLLTLAILLGLWRRWLPLPWLGAFYLGCTSALYVVLMALHLYAPGHDLGTELRVLYLWIPLNYVLAFVVGDHRRGLGLSLAIFGAFVAASLPRLLAGPNDGDSNATAHLHATSAALIAALYFLSSYRQHLLVAESSLEELDRLANTDTLTQVANRRRASSLLDDELTRHAQHRLPLALVLIDVDHFKAINDRHGHRAGDDALVALSRQLAAQLRPTDTLGRWGGEEFIVLLPHTHYPQAMALAERLRAQAASAVPGATATLTISCGVTAAIDADTSTSFIDRADRALYAAKHAGRNRVAGLPAATDST